MAKLTKAQTQAIEQVRAGIPGPEHNPGLKILDRQDGQAWYGGGYCGICGDHQVLPVCVKYWEPDDGWKIGTLCAGCADDAAIRGPQPDDYANRPTMDDELSKSEKLGILASILGDDQDGLMSEAEDLQD